MHDLPSDTRAPSHARDLLHLLIGVTCGLALGLAALHLVRWGTDPELERYARVRDFVADNYAREITPRELVDRSLHGMLESLDPYSRFYDASEIAALERETTGKYRGIGVVFAVPRERSQILLVLPDSPAARAGLRPGDTLIAVDGRSVADIGHAQLRALLTDAERGDLSLRVRARDGSERTTSIGQASLVDPTVRHGRMLDEERGIAYVALLAFSQETDEEFDAEVARLRAQGARALVVDVRGNLGGVLKSAVELANRFVERGLIVSHEGRGDAVRFEADSKHATCLGLPLVVLTDGSSASASEVFAAAVQEYRVGALVGEPTYGKGMVQQVQAFGDDAVVKLITSYYFTPSHHNFERTLDRAWDKGLVPDVLVELAEAERDAVHAQLASYSASDEDLAEIRAWERDEGRTLLPAWPPDAQLDAAVALLRGEKPEPWLAQAK